MTPTARIEGRVQIGIMLLMGGGAGAASFKHIHDLAVHYGQPSWIGWANATVVELMSIVSGLEIRRRKRTGQSAGFVYLVFFGAVLISLAANVAKAHPSPWGWIMAALPALGFLAVVKIVLTREPVETGPDRPGTEDTVAGLGPDQTPIFDTRILENARVKGMSSGPTERPDQFLAAVRPDRTAVVENTGPADTADPPTDRHMLPPQAPPVDKLDPSLTDPIRANTTVQPDPLGDEKAHRSTENQVVPVQRINGHHTNCSAARTADEERLWPGSGLLGTRTGPSGDRSDADMSGLDRSRPNSDLFGTRTGPSREADVSGPVRTSLNEELRELGLTIAAKVRMRKDTLTRQVLIDEIRCEGRTIGTDRASKLLAWIKETEKASLCAD